MNSASPLHCLRESRSVVRLLPGRAWDHRRWWRIHDPAVMQWVLPDRVGDGRASRLINTSASINKRGSSCFRFLEARVFRLSKLPSRKPWIHNLAYRNVVAGATYREAILQSAREDGRSPARLRAPSVARNRNAWPLEQSSPPNSRRISASPIVNEFRARLRR